MSEPSSSFPDSSLTSKRSGGDIQPKPPKKSKKKHGGSDYEFRRTIQQCCATNDLPRGIKAYDEAVSNAVKIEAQTFYNLLNLCDGLGQRGIHVGTPRLTPGSPSSPTTKANSSNDTPSSDEPKPVIDASTRLKYAQRIKAHMDSLKLPLTENALSALVKLHCKVANTEKAEELLTQGEQTQQCKPKLRLYSTLLSTYCDMGRLPEALKIWRRLSEQDLVLSEKEYASLMKCSVKVGNVPAMERVLSDLAEDVLVPSMETGNIICEWFRSAFAYTDEAPPYDPTTNQLLESIKLPYAEPAAFMGPVQCSSEYEWSIDTGVGIQSGRLCSGCLAGEALQPVSLSDRALETIKRMNETIVTTGKLENDQSAFQGGKKGPKKQLKDSQLEERRNHWKAFNDYLGRRQHKIDVVIDGANVGYCDQNFASAPKCVDYQQIDWLIRHFTDQGKTVMIAMHNRHFSRKLMPASAEPIVRGWSDALYQTPNGMNDDWFWLHAALTSVAENVLVVTNDKMRDHHFQMLAPRFFLRWLDRHQVLFSFGEWERNSKTGRKERKVELTYPEQYSRRIQRVNDGLVVPLPKRGDENRFLDGNFVAQDEATPEEETYLCIRPTTRRMDAR